MFQANCYAEESYSLSSMHCAEVSVDLKRARSLVRVNEIQSTLQEQRYSVLQFSGILYLCVVPAPAARTPTPARRPSGLLMVHATLTLAINV